MYALYVCLIHVPYMYALYEDTRALTFVFSILPLATSEGTALPLFVSVCVSVSVSAVVIVVVVPAGDAVVVVGVRVVN